MPFIYDFTSKLIERRSNDMYKTAAYKSKYKFRGPTSRDFSTSISLYSDLPGSEALVQFSDI